MPDTCLFPNHESHRIVDDYWNYGRFVNGGTYENTETILVKLQGRLFLTLLDPRVGFLIEERFKLGSPRIYYRLDHL